MNDHLVEETSTWEKTALTKSVHGPGGVWTHNICRWAAADPCLRPRGHWDRWSTIMS